VSKPDRELTATALQAVDVSSPERQEQQRRRQDERAVEAVDLV